MSWKRATLILVLALFIVRLPSLFYPIMDVDESIYGLFARIWFDGGLPYINCVETKPLGIYLFYGTIFSIFGRFNMIAVHAVTIIIVGITAYVINLISKEIYSRRAGFWAALLYIVFTTTYIPKVLATTIEPIMLLPVALQFYWWIRFEKEERGLFALASGAAFSAACLFKYQAGINLVVMIVYLGLVKPYFVRGAVCGTRWRGFLRFIVGGIPLPAIMLLYLYFKGSLGAFFFWSVSGNIGYISEGSESISFFHQLLVRFLPYIISTLLVWVLCVARVVGVGRKLFSTEGRGSVDVHETLIIAWFLLSFIPVSTGLRFYGHYFLLLMPSMAIVASKAADAAWSLKDRPWIRRLVLIWIIVPAAGFTVARIFMSDIHTAIGEDNVNDYKPIAAYVAQHTKSDDRVVAWGFAPLIYWYSERLPGTRFFWSDLLTGRVPGSKGAARPRKGDKLMSEAWEMFFSDLGRNRPIYIIDTAPAGLHDYENYPMTRFPQMMDYIDRHYRREAVVNGALFYRRID